MNPTTLNRSNTTWFITYWYKSTAHSPKTYRTITVHQYGKPTLSTAGQYVQNDLFRNVLGSTLCTACTPKTYWQLHMVSISDTAPVIPPGPPPPPPPPTGTVTLTATAVTPTEIDLSWTAATGTGITYSVYQGAALLVSGLPGLSYPATGLAQNTAYSFYVAAVNAYGSLTSNTASATTPYAAPTAPVLTATAISSTEIDLTWPAVTGLAVTYSVYGSTSSGFAPGPSNLLASGLSVLYYHNTGLSSLTGYYYKVVATNPAGSATSNQANATTLGVAPSGSINLTATVASGSAATLTWTAATGIGITYNVYRALTTGFTPGAGNLITSGVSGLTYPDTGLSTYTPYFYRVVAVNAYGTLESNEATVTPVPPTSLIPIMTSNTAPSGIASCSAHVGSFDAYVAFQPLGTWVAQSPPITLPQWIQYQFVNPVLAVETEINFNQPDDHTVVLSGSNNGSTWIVLTTINNSGGGGVMTQNFSNSIRYSYYRWTITYASDLGIELELQGLLLYGYP